MSRRAAQKELHEFSKERGERRNLNAYTLMDAKGGKRRLNTEACFSYIRGLGRNAKGYDYIISISRENGLMPFEDCNHFLKWLLNDSPVAKMFFTKSPRVAWKKGVVVDCHRPNQAIGFGLTMHRTIWENPGYIRTFNRLYEAGVDPAVCAVIMSCTATDEIGKCNFTAYGISHGPFSEVDVDSIRMFKKGAKMIGHEKGSLYDEGSYADYHYLFSSGGQLQIWDVLSKGVPRREDKGAFGSYTYTLIEDVIEFAKKLEEDYCG